MVVFKGLWSKCQIDNSYINGNHSFSDMPEKTVSELSFRKRGVFDVNKVFSAPAKFLKKNGFKVLESEIAEKGSEREIKYSADLKPTYYVKYSVEVVLKAWDIKSGEKGMSSGALSVKITSKMETDYRKEWEGEWKSFIVKVRDKLVITGELKKQKDTLVALTKQLYENVKGGVLSAHV